MTYISSRRKRWPVARFCGTLGVSQSGYHKHLRFKNKPDKHANLLAQIDELIKEDEENANYGVRCIFDYLRLKRNHHGSLRKTLSGTHFRFL